IHCQQLSENSCRQLKNSLCRLSCSESPDQSYDCRGDAQSLTSVHWRWSCHGHQAFKTRGRWRVEQGEMALVRDSTREQIGNLAIPSKPVENVSCREIVGSINNQVTVG